METTSDSRHTIFRLFVFSFAIFLFAALQQPKAFAAGTFSLTPASGTLLKSCTASVAIQEAITSGQSDAADIIVTYDPTKIDIVDSLPAIAGTQISPGNAYESYAGNTVDTLSGIIKLVGYSTGSTLSSTATFATIQFKPKSTASSGSFTITFTGANPYNSLDSNISDASSSYDMLSGVSNATYTFTSGSCATDTTAPTITFNHPTNLQNNVPPNSTVSLTLQDAGSGVALSTFSLTINGTTYTSTSPGVSVSGSPSSYTITVVPSQPFPSNSLSVLTAIVQDAVGNARTQSITINSGFSCPAQPVKYINTCTPGGSTPTPTPTIDSQSPTLTINTPLSDLATKKTTVLSVTATDTSGISPESFLLTLGGKDFSLQTTPALVSASGNKTTMTFTIQVDIDTLQTTAEGKIAGQLRVSDLSGNTRYEALTLDTGKTNSQPTVLTATTTPAILSAFLLPFAIAAIGFLLYLFTLTTGPTILVVVDAVTKKPVRFSQVSIKRAGQTILVRQGAFDGSVHAKLLPGEYMATIQKYGYQPQTIALSVSGDRTPPKIVSLTRI